MDAFQFYIGIDIAKDDFACTILSTPASPIASIENVPNEISGFEQLVLWFETHSVTAANSIICLEATGVYGETLSYWFTAKGYSIVVENPLKVKRAFEPKSHKNDKVDSHQIAEYAYRFVDELRIWRPKNEVIEQINVLLMTREQLVTQKTAQVNTLKAIRRKIVQTPLANKIYEDNIKQFKAQIKTIESEIQKHIDQHPDFKNTVRFLKTLPGVKLLLAANLLVITNGFENDLTTNSRKMAAYIGICPYEFKSGSSVYKKPKIPHYGPARLRKLLHLAARSVTTHNKRFQNYKAQKEAEGKEPSLILNNVSNKILKICCAIMRTQKPYMPNHLSMHPEIGC